MDLVFPCVTGEVNHKETIVNFCDIEPEGIGKRGPSQVSIADHSAFIVPSECGTEIIVIDFIQDLEFFKSVRVD
jgi:hypothetical protein